MKSLYDSVEDVLLSYHNPAFALATLRTTASLTALLGFLREDAARLGVVANHSYRHRNGFDKIVLASPRGSPLKLVLHVWPKGGLETSDNIHNHRWDFSSVVICGALRLELYEQDVRGKSYSVMQYRPTEGVGNFELHLGGIATVSARAAVTMTVGSTYSWARDHLHRAWGMSGQVTATLIVQGPPTREKTTVLVGEDDAHRLDGPQRLYRLGMDEVDSTLATLAGGNIQQAWHLDGSQSSHLDGSQSSEHQL
jgi:hypothetical protein